MMRSDSFSSGQRRASTGPDADSLPPNLAFKISENPDFELLVNVIIAGNCVALALQDPLLGDHEGRNAPLWWIGQCSFPRL